MRFTEKLLLYLSRKPEGKDYQSGRGTENLAEALWKLCGVFPNFLDSIANKQILDFGCGRGRQAVGLARNGARYVLGIDTNQKFLDKARHLARQFGVGEKVEFADELEDRFKGKFDIVISHNSMEHFRNPGEVLDEMKSALNQDGVIRVTFGPPWFAPYGAHMHFFTKVPWVNIIFDEKTVMNVRRHFRKDGPTKYEQVEGGLNKMTVAKFERIMSCSGMEIQWRNYECIKGLSFLGKLPPNKRTLYKQHKLCTS